MSNISLFGTGLTIGKSVKTQRRIRLTDQARSTYILGSHGTGKSTLLMNLILQDIERNDKGILLLDPHGDLARSVMLRCPKEHAERLTYFSPAEQKKKPLGFNPFETNSPDELSLKVDALLSVFMHSWYGSFQKTPVMQNTLETIVRTMLSCYEKHQLTFDHMRLLLKEDSDGKHWRAKLSAEMTNPAVKDNWTRWKNTHEFKKDTQSSRGKVNHLIQDDILRGILTQPKSASIFNFEEMLSKNGVLIVNLQLLDNESQRLLGSLILTQLVAMARLRTTESERTPCHIYADEFYNFSPESFITIINETRKYKLFCTLAHQTRAQLTKESAAAASNCGNVIIFKVNPKDSRQMREHFITIDSFLPSHILSSLPKYQAMVRILRRKQSIQARIKTYPERGEENSEVARQIWKRSAEYGIPVEQLKTVEKPSKHDKGRKKRKTAENATNENPQDAEGENRTGKKRKRRAVQKKFEL